MKKLFLLLVFLTAAGCTNHDEADVQQSVESLQNSVSSPAESVKSIKDNVQSTLDKIKARDQYQQDLAN